MKISILSITVTALIAALISSLLAVFVIYHINKRAIFESTELSRLVADVSKYVHAHGTLPEDPVFYKSYQLSIMTSNEDSVSLYIGIGLSDELHIIRNNKDVYISTDGIK